MPLEAHRAGTVPASPGAEALSYLFFLALIATTFLF
jgi:hypothetical protein